MTWRENRELSYLMNDWDDINLPYIIDNNDVAKQVVHFFETESKLIFPAKSYFVAIVYAKGLEKYFGEDFYKVLDSKDLLPDDKYFKPYSEDIETYDYILNHIGNVWESKAISKTLDYFKREFLVKD